MFYLNRSDTEAELEIVKSKAREAGAFDAVICEHYALGSAGATQLAAAVEAATKEASNFKLLYDLEVACEHITFIKHLSANFFSKLLKYMILNTKTILC